MLDPGAKTKGTNYFNAVPDPAVHCNADPDPAFHSYSEPDRASKNHSDPDPQPCFKHT